MWSLLLATRPSIALAVGLLVPALVLWAWGPRQSVRQPRPDGDPLLGMDTLTNAFLALWGGLGLDALTSAEFPRLVAPTLPGAVQLAAATLIVGWLPAAILLTLCCRSRVRQFAVWVGGVCPIVLLAAARLLLYSDVPPWR